VIETAQVLLRPEDQSSGTATMARSLRAKIDLIAVGEQGPSPAFGQSVQASLTPKGRPLCRALGAEWKQAGPYAGDNSSDGERTEVKVEHCIE
jgi:hypothetical protein